MVCLSLPGWEATPALDLVDPDPASDLAHRDLVRGLHPELQSGVPHCGELRSHRATGMGYRAFYPPACGRNCGAGVPLSQTLHARAKTTNQMGVVWHDHHAVVRWHVCGGVQRAWLW